MVATTGAKLLPSEALRELRTSLLPQATVLTPNIPEARLLLADAGLGEMPLQTVADLERLARALQTLGPEWVLVKGGHCPFQSDGTVATAAAEKQLVVDVLYGNGQAFTIETPYHHSRNTHGTGCSLACKFWDHVAKTSLAVRFCDERDSCHCVESRQGAGCSAGDQEGLQIRRGRHQDGPRTGKGQRPFTSLSFDIYPAILTVGYCSRSPAHLATSCSPFSNHAPGSDRFVEYLLERPEVAPLWDRYVYHPFVLAMGDGTLPLESFKEYLTQDYIYLVRYPFETACRTIQSDPRVDPFRQSKRLGRVQSKEHGGHCRSTRIPFLRHVSNPKLTRVGSKYSDSHLQ